MLKIDADTAKQDTLPADIRFVCACGSVNRNQRHIVTAFQKMAETGSGGLGTVSAGIAEALVTTAFGLLVAIPAVMGFNFLQGWVDGRAVDIAESSNEFLDVVAREIASKESGHAEAAE